MRNLFILLIALLGFSSYSQEVKKEVDFPMSVYDQVVKLRNAKWNKSKMSIPNKITEVTENGKFLRYEFEENGKVIQFYVSPSPYDYVMSVSDFEKTNITTCYFLNGTFWCDRHFSSDGQYWVYHYSEKRLESTIRIK